MQVATAEPPPPPRHNPRPDPLQRSVLLLIALLALALFVARQLALLPKPMLVERAAFFLALYVALVAATWLPPSLISRRIDAMLERWIGSGSGGYYGLMSLATFVSLELAAVRATFTDMLGGELDLDAAVLSWVLGFSLDSVMNMVEAFVWFLPLAREGVGIASVLFLAGTWGIFVLGGRVLPAVAPPQSDGLPRKRR